jgi:hypothetical protein
VAGAGAGAGAAALEENDSASDDDWHRGEIRNVRDARHRRRFIGVERSILVSGIDSIFLVLTQVGPVV